MNGSVRCRLISGAFCMIAAGLIWGGGCLPVDRTHLAVDQIRSMMVSMKQSTNRNPDIEMVRDSLPLQLVQLDALITVSPDETDLLLAAAEANAGYAFFFVQDTDKLRGACLLQKARDYALRALMRRQSFQEAMQSDSAAVFGSAVSQLDRTDVPALYWVVSSWLGLISLRIGEDIRAVADLAKVEMMMDRLLVLDGAYHYGAIHAIKGAYLSSHPIVFGGNLEEAEDHFQRAFEISESRYLVWHYLYARHYAVQRQDRALFSKMLTAIVDAPLDLLPEQNFANEAVRLKAKALLAAEDILFHKETAAR